MTIADLHLTHSEDYIQSLQSNLVPLSTDLYLNSFSYEAAVRSAGCALAVTQHVISGFFKHEFAGRI
jgi:acetoin utilization deacetylase AcuC-like enzyme